MHEDRRVGRSGGGICKLDLIDAYWNSKAVNTHRDRLPEAGLKRRVVVLVEDGDAVVLSNIAPGQSIARDRAIVQQQGDRSRVAGTDIRQDV